MRKPRDFDSELKALIDKANTLKKRKISHFGELVIATGADVLDPETLTGALLMIAETSEAAKREVWRNRGAAFFRGQSRKSAGRSASNAQGAQADKDDGAAR